MYTCLLCGALYAGNPAQQHGEGELMVGAKGRHEAVAAQAEVAGMVCGEQAGRARGRMVQEVCG